MQKAPGAALGALAGLGSIEDIIRRGGDIGGVVGYRPETGKRANQ